MVLPYLTGSDLNGDPLQRPSRFVIDFKDFSLDKAATYPELFEQVLQTVKPQRDKVKRKVYREIWWQYAEKCSGLYRTIANKDRVLVVAQVSRTLGFAFTSTNKVFSAKAVVFDFQDYASFALLQSTFHNVWAWKHCTTMKSDLSYGPTNLFQTFPFPPIALLRGDNKIEAIGSDYYEHRDGLMRSLWLGLTKLYNLFHDPELSVEMVADESGKDEEIAREGYEGLVELRRLHVEMDNAVLNAYGWQDLDLGHDFHEVETLPENDRTRFTISPTARKEVLKRLLALNHARAAEEGQKGLHDKRKTAKKPMGRSTVAKGPTLFDTDAEDNNYA